MKGAARTAVIHRNGNQMAGSARLRVPCPTCGAQPGHACRRLRPTTSKSGEYPDQLPRLHSTRKAGTYKRKAAAS